jgi:hypothetical protein
MDGKQGMPAETPVGTDPCRKVGSFVSKEGCFALRSADGQEVWLEIDPVPLHMLDEEVEIIGRQFGQSLVWVQSIGPARRFS